MRRFLIGATAGDRLPSQRRDRLVQVVQGAADLGEWRPVASQLAQLPVGSGVKAVKAAERSVIGSRGSSEPWVVTYRLIERAQAD
jgi:hypothetical protein